MNVFVQAQAVQAQAVKYGLAVSGTVLRACIWPYKRRLMVSGVCIVQLTETPTPFFPLPLRKEVPLLLLLWLWSGAA